RTAAILALRDRPLELVVLDRMILDFHREPANARFVARPLRHGPALHYTVQLEPEVEVQVTRLVFLHDEAQCRRALLPRRSHGRRRATRRLARLREITLAPILGELRRCALRATAAFLRRHCLLASPVMTDHQPASFMPCGA